jgi:hypothetical protein
MTVLCEDKAQKGAAQGRSWQRQSWELPHFHAKLDLGSFSDSALGTLATSTPGSRWWAQ